MGRHGGEKKGGGWGYGSVITAMGLMDVWGLNWLLMTAEASPCFYQLSAGFPPITQSLSLSLSPLPLLSILPHFIAAVYSWTFFTISV